LLNTANQVLLYSENGCFARGALADYYLGVDGGQSSTTALICNESGRVLGAGRSGPCNHASGDEGRRKFFRAVGGCLSEACKQAGLDAATIEFQAACLGFSGGAADKKQYSRELVRSRRLYITHDAEIALSGATAGSPGIIIIAGTGSMAFGSNSQGRTARAGGWGYIYGDEGGGFDMARKALRAALRMEEGWGPATSIHADLLKATNSPDADTLLHCLYTSEFSRPEIAALSKLVTEAAEAGDSVATEILGECANELSVYVEGVYRNLFAPEPCPSVCYIGGVFRSRILLECFQGVIRQKLDVTPSAPKLSPAAGALLAALRQDGNLSQLENLPTSEK
jgi:N-acetylglucosamine kinase-like BadF-type ATPase